MRQERYDVSVNLKKREENKKTAYNIIEICKKNNWKKIGVVSSTSYKKDKVVAILSRSLKKAGETGISFTEIEPLKIYADAIYKIQDCDAVVLAEKYNYTKFSDFEDMLQILKEYNINIVGVVTF